MKKKRVERYYNEKGELGVIISPGYGGGWSTWYNKEIAYDKRIIEKFLEIGVCAELCDYVESLGYLRPHLYFNKPELVFIPKGTLFCITEYDGYESIETPKTLGMMKA